MVAAISKKRRIPDGGTDRMRSESRPAMRAASRSDVGTAGAGVGGMSAGRDVQS